MQLSGLLLLTFRELRAKKIIMGLFLVSTLVWLMLTFALNLDIVDGTLAGVRIFGQEADATQATRDADSGEIIRQALALDKIVIAVEAFVAGAAYWAGILLSLFATASLLPSLLEQGRVDLLLSKPISRTRVLGGHILGVLLSMLSLAVYLLGMVWLVMSLKTGIWHVQFLLAIPVVTGMFAVMYSVITLLGVWTRSAPLALIIAYGLIFASLILAAKDQLAPQINLPWRHVYVGLYHLLPNFGEVTRTIMQLSQAEPVASWYPLFSSFLFGLVLYGGAVILFQRRDF